MKAAGGGRPVANGEYVSKPCYRGPENLDPVSRLEAGLVREGTSDKVRMRPEARLPGRW